MEPSSITSLQKAIAVAGGQLALARKLGLKQGHIWWWLNRSKRVPAKQVLAIEAETGISRYELRPDVYGPAPSNEDRAA
jgi:DNA-binding transcriptional regulator YdaS (Cro superfamily)